jgi:hypothetical protein
MDTVLTVLIALALSGLMYYLVRRKISRDDRVLAGRFAFGDDGISQSGVAYPVYFEGTGAQTTGAFRLQAGRHRLRYDSAADSILKVELLTASGDEHETLVMTAGTGEREFSVDAGRYLLDLEPAVENSRWRVSITPLQLPSHRPDSML